MYHINDNGEMKPCSAQNPEDCEFYKGESDPRCYKDPVQAAYAAERVLEDKYSHTGTLKKGKQETLFDDKKKTDDSDKTDDTDSDEKKVRYSFTKEFKEQEENFDEKFGKFPTRFFSTEIDDDKCYPRIKMGSYSIEERLEALNQVPPGPDADINEIREYMNKTNVDEKRIVSRILRSVSSPDDAKISNSDFEKVLENSPYTYRKLSDEELSKLYGNKATRGWIVSKDVVAQNTIHQYYSENGKIGARTVNPGETYQEYMVVSDKNDSNGLGRYRMRFGGPPELKNNFRVTDMRNFVGGERVRQKIGVDPMGDTIDSTRSYSSGDLKRKKDALRALDAVKEAQFEGSNFINQKKYIKGSTGKVATAWMDKKNPDELHKKMMKETVLNNHFRKVEIDNDVDPEEYAAFEKDYQEVVNKLPAIPKGLEPELRIRKLGKHRATGMFFPHKNTIAIDVRDSSSFVHEYGHYTDLVVKNNASLSNDFREISKGYSSSIKVPPEMKGKEEYYNTATEQFARLTELYAHEKLGINNKLVNPGKFSRFDYEPYQKNPELKEKGFKLLDKVFYGKK